MKKSYNIIWLTYKMYEKSSAAFNSISGHVYPDSTSGRGKQMPLSLRRAGDVTNMYASPGNQVVDDDVITGRRTSTIFALPAWRHRLDKFTVLSKFAHFSMFIYYSFSQTNRLRVLLFWIQRSSLVDIYQGLMIFMDISMDISIDISMRGYQT